MRGHFSRVHNWVDAEGGLGRGHPDPLDSEGCHVVQTLSETGQITHAIAVPVREAARMGLIDDGELQPGVGMGGWFLPGAWGSRLRRLLEHVGLVGHAVSSCRLRPERWFGFIEDRAGATTLRSRAMR